VNNQAISPSANSAEGGPSQPSLDGANSEFWTELCGSSLARMLGVKDASVESLARFDNWYFDFYRYLLPFVNLGACKGKRTLEVGLGYGSLSQELAKSGSIYTGLDISPGPVAMVNLRLAQKGLPGRAIEGSVLKCPFPDQSFDVAVAIGSLHHTGDLALALQELHRVIVPGGRVVFMVYNALSYRRWARWPMATMRHALWARGIVSEKPSPSESERAAYDADADGNAAPETVFCTAGELRRMMRNWSIETIQLKNIGDESLLRHLPRELKLKTMGWWTGLDIYVRATRR
jgi:ubiquinone/menaquinone biosynthesis C-methylase UbiE